MAKADIRELKKYLFPAIVDLYLVLYYSLVLIILAYVSPNPFHPARIIAIVSFSLLLFFNSRNELRQLFLMQDFFKTHANASCMEQILKDFRSKNCLGTNSIHLGKQYIIGKQGAIPFRYEDILRIYEYRDGRERTSYKSFIKPRCYIYATTAKGEFPLARVPNCFLSEQDFSILYQTIKSKNPRVQWVIMKRKSLGLEIEYEPYK